MSTSAPLFCRRHFATHDLSIHHCSHCVSIIYSSFIMPDSRYTRKGRHAYNTRSNRARPIRTPGGKLVAQIIKKSTKGPRCSDWKMAIQGIKHLKNGKAGYKNLKKRERTVSRAYGGSCCAPCVRQRIMRAFLLEEQKAVKKVLAERQGKK